MDFVLYGDDGLWAFEVKNSAHIQPRDVRGLTAFREDYPEAQCALLYRGTERIMVRDTLCIPMSEFLESLHPDRVPLPLD